MSRKRIVVAVPHGFCAGVRHAVDIAETALRVFGPPIYCLNELVHNRQVVDGLAARGMRFVTDIRDVPRGARVLLSAHGVAPEVKRLAAERGLDVLDATCPFVNKVHAEVRRYAREGRTILLIGHAAHDEIVGVRGEAPERVVVIESAGQARSAAVPDPARVAAVTQTTLSVDETARTLLILRERFPALRTPRESDVCFATQNRQKAALRLAEVADLILVLGSESSSNTRRLLEVARSGGRPAFLVSSMASLDAVRLDGVETVGLTAGASTPEPFVREVLERLRAAGFGGVEELKVADETIHFPLPARLRGRRAKGVAGARGPAQQRRFRV
jgi:4-hydroxy-3-methylbut-2-enyl diphosphate reductase